MAQLKKANGAFKERKYAVAIPLYEAALQKKQSLLAKTRLAFSYRMLNRMDDAERLYAQIVEEPRARAETLRYYAEALMSNAKYEEAKEWFGQYTKLEPQDTTVFALMKACDIAPTIKPYFSGIAIREFSQNSEQDDNTPLFHDGMIVFTSDRPSGALLKQKSGFTGRDYLRIYASSYDKSLHVFQEAKGFSSKVNSYNKNTANPSFYGAGAELYFSQNNSEGTDRGEHKLQLYRVEKNDKGKWRNQKRLEFCKADFNYMHPSVSADGNSIYFVSDIKGQGGFDLFVSHKGKDGWKRPKNLGAIVNSSGHEAFPYMHSDGRLFFASKGHPGFGGFDIFVTYFDSTAGEWQRPLNMGRPINSPTDDVSFSLSPNDSTGLFASSRSGGDDDIFLFWLGGKKRLLTALYPVQTDTLSIEPTLDQIQKSPVRMEKDTLTKLAVPSLDIDDFIPTLETLAADIDSNRVSTEEAYVMRYAVYSNDEDIEVPVSAATDVSLLLSVLNTHPELSIRIAVHSNKKAKQAKERTHARAMAWKKLLTASGIAGNRIAVKGLAATVPIRACSDCLLSPFERVEVKVLPMAADE